MPGSVVIIVSNVARIVGSFHNPVRQVVLKINDMPGGRDKLLEVAHVVPVQTNVVAGAVAHVGGRALRVTSGMVGFREKKPAAVGEIKRPAIAVPGVLRAKKFR